MLGVIARKIFGSANDREVKALRATVEQVNALEPEVEKLSDDELRARTDWLRERLSKGETLKDILPDAFRHRPRGGQACAGRTSLRCPAYGRHGSDTWQDRRDENR